MLKIDRSKLIQELVKKYKYPENTAELYADRLAIIDPLLEAAFDRYIKDNTVLDFSIETEQEYSIKKFMKEKKLDFFNALLSIDWIIKHPDKKIEPINKLKNSKQDKTAKDKSLNFKVLFWIDKEVIEENLVKLMENYGINLDYERDRDSVISYKLVLKRIEDDYDMVIINEMLANNEEHLLDIVSKVKENGVRPIVLFRCKEPNDPVFTKLIDLGVYDFLHSKLKLDDIFDLMLNPRNKEAALNGIQPISSRQDYLKNRINNLNNKDPKVLLISDRPEIVRQLSAFIREKHKIKVQWMSIEAKDTWETLKICKFNKIILFGEAIRDLSINKKVFIENIEKIISPEVLTYVMMTGDEENEELKKAFETSFNVDFIEKQQATASKLAELIIAYLGGKVFVNKQSKEAQDNMFEDSEFKVDQDDIRKIELEKVMTQLNGLIGMENVKEKVSQLISYLKFTKKVETLGISNIRPNLHMVFTGNPGTGKTTLARIMAKILYGLNLVPENKLIEVERKDLVAEYIGQSAPKTTKVINNAMGGVLFIDEAYSLVPSDSFRDFGKEVISTLITAMENNYDKFVVIFAGYKEEMKHFIDSNPGIKSRIGYTIDFENYSAEELLEIFKNICNNNGFELNKDAEKPLLEIFKKSVSFKNFGNGRFARNLFEKTLLYHAMNTEDSNDINVLKTITVEDISDEILKEFDSSEKKIGF